MVRILLVDDDAAVGDSLRILLEMDGHDVILADQSRTGIDLFAAALSREPFGMVITDFSMPEMDGKEVARAVKQASPATPVILLTGWGERNIDGEAPSPDIHCVLGKPPKLRELRDAIENAAVGLTQT